VGSTEHVGQDTGVTVWSLHESGFYRTQPTVARLGATITGTL
jgi:hypothetical protein